MRIFAIATILAFVAAPAFAHVTVAPQQSAAGASQVYKVRVHNDSKVPTASVALHVPAGVTISSVEPIANAKSDLTKTGDHVTMITWQVEVPVDKYVELAFTAKNPASGQLNWNVTEKFKDGTTVEFTDKPGAEEKSSVTKLTSASAPATSAKPPAAAKPATAKPAAPATK